MVLGSEICKISFGPIFDKLANQTPQEFRVVTPDVMQNLPDDIERRAFQAGLFPVALRLSVIRTWNETIKGINCKAK